MYQSNLPSLSHGLPSFLESKTALSTNFKSSAAMVVTIKHRPSPLAMLPFVVYNYQLEETLLYSKTGMGKAKQIFYF